MSDVPNTVLRYVAFGVIEIVRVSAASSRPLGRRRWCGRSRSSERCDYIRVLARISIKVTTFQKGGCKDGKGQN